jgi:hypothetical protein
MTNQWSRKRWISVAAFGMLCLTFATVSVNEALAVSVFGKAVEYPFGGEGPSGDIWYYQSAAKYFWVNAISGTLWLLILLSTIYATFRKSETWLLRSVGCAMALFVLELLNPAIGRLLY